MALYEVKCKVVNSLGIHARPSSLIAKAATKHVAVNSGQVFVSKGGVKADSSSIMSVMMLGATFGEELIVFTNVDSLHEAVDDVVDIINRMKEYDGE
jgi:phosphocarrier protein